jgi:tetratricopeptide (TPR) repeat protein
LLHRTRFRKSNKSILDWASCQRNRIAVSIRLCRLIPLPFILLSCAFAQETADRSAVVEALQAHDFPRALQLLDPLLKEYPNNAELRAMQGTSYAGQNRKQEALSSFQRALKISPDYVVALQGAAQIQFDNGDLAAIPYLKRLVRIRPTDPTGHGMLAVLEYQQGNCDAAVRHFALAGSLFDDRPPALHGYATCLVKLGQYDRAATLLQRTVLLSPDDQRERRLLAAVQLMGHHPESALATLQPLLDSGTENADVLELAATAHEQQKDTPQAVSTLRQAILLEPRNVNFYLDFANLSSTHDSYQVGIDVLTDGIGQLPEAAPLYLARGVLYVQLAQYEKAETDFETAHQLDPNQSLTSAAQGLLAVQEHDLDKALKTVQERLARKPTDPLLLYLQADFLSQKGADPGTPDFQLAMRSAKQAVSLQPTLSEARSVLAKLYLEAGNYGEAAEQCRKALEHDPKDQTAAYRLIQALRKTGNQKEIPDLLKKLAELRKAAAREQSQHYQYKLVEEDSGLK